mmetsp:Transcript_65989/g.144067  ORF Transcript_65989/g.144067 Transcript_65989/m.144067 type:complete len:93 (-) Transcript_65989:957-1235(-)
MCGRPRSVKISQDFSAPRRGPVCVCRPAWCHHCLFRWWLSRNKTHLSSPTHTTTVLMAPCPTCRVEFRLDHLVPLADVVIDPVLVDGTDVAP